MRWILDHIEIFAAVVAGVAYWLSSKRRKSGEEGPAPLRKAERLDRSERDSGLAEARRIRDEMRRRRAEREASDAGGRREDPVFWSPADKSESAAHGLNRESNQADVPELPLENRRGAHLTAQARPLADPLPVAGESARPPGTRRKSSWFNAAELRSGQLHVHVLRRAVVLKEILDPPVSLRDPPRRA